MSALLHSIDLFYTLVVLIGAALVLVFAWRMGAVYGPADRRRRQYMAAQMARWLVTRDENGDSQDWHVSKKGALMAHIRVATWRRFL